MEEDQATEASTDESAPVEEAPIVEEAPAETTNEAESSVPASVSEPAIRNHKRAMGAAGSSTQVSAAPAEQPQGVRKKKLLGCEAEVSTTT